MRTVLLLLLLAACASAVAEPVPAAPTPTHSSETEDEGAVAVATRRQIPLAEALAEHRGELVLLVDKSDRTLTVQKGGVDVRTYGVGLAPGIDSDNDKVRQGDLATPEGEFTVVTRNDRSRFHLFLGLSYPTAEDAERGLRDGLITEAQARAIREADAAGRPPPWNTRLGGEIGIHGGGGSGDWTLGCVAVDNAEIEELWAVARHGTKVRIRD